MHIHIIAVFFLNNLNILGEVHELLKERVLVATIK